jgi:ABC-2 type transport system ATP-binding protein
LYAITTESLGKQFGKRWAVKDLALQIRQGEIFGLLGPNGAGKTTTMRMLACLIAPSSGTAVVCGYDIRRNPTEIRRRTGIMTEAPGLYETLSPLENLGFYGKLYDMSAAEVRKQAEHYLRLFELWDRRHDIVAGFSKGMKQKLALVRALLHGPQMLILDEPTSALDPEGAKIVRDCISALRGEGCTIILCTHNLSEAQALCDRVAIIKNMLLKMGTPRELQQSLYGRQVEIKLANPHSPPHSRLHPPPNLDLQFPAPAPETQPRPDPAQDGNCLNDLAVLVAGVAGVRDVVVAGDSMLMSTLDPDEVVPEVVRLLVGRGADIVRVAEVEYPLERAYLDLVARYNGEGEASEAF